MALLWIALGAWIFISPIKEKLSDVLGVSVAEKPGGTPADNPALKKQIIRWEEIIAARPDYRDGYYALATLEYQMGNTEKSKKYLGVVKRLDPNYPEITELEALLSSPPQ